MSGAKRETEMDMDKLASLPPLARGAHNAGSGTACLLEAVAYVAGEPWSDHPSCASYSVAAFGRTLNDAMPDEFRDTLLRPLVPLIVGTRSTGAVERRRAYIAADYAVREAAPAALRAIGLHAEADTLAAMPSVVDARTARAATRAVVDAAAAAAAAARAAAAAAGTGSHPCADDFVACR